MPIDRRRAKEDMVHTYNGTLLRHKRNAIMAFAATRMALEMAVLSEMNQTERYKHHIMPLT